jgi:hypothetical protein
VCKLPKKVIDDLLVSEGGKEHAGFTASIAADQLLTCLPIGYSAS